MSRVLVLACLVVLAGLALLLLLLQPRTAAVEPATMEREPVREMEDVSGRASATLSVPELAVVASPEPEPAQAGMEPATVLPSAAPAPYAAQRGTVAGRVVFVGDVPTVRPLDIPDSFQVGCCDPGRSVDTTDRSLLLDDLNGIANVVVTIKVEDVEARPLLDPFHIDQSGCRFEPHVSVVPTGTTVTFRNLDRTAHNVHTFARENDSLNRTILPRAEDRQKLAEQDRIEVKCDIHPWMSGWLVVVDTPYFAVTDVSGRFAIEDLPVGRHKVEVWHERLGTSESFATVSPGERSGAIEIRMTEEKHP